MNDQFSQHSDQLDQATARQVRTDCELDAQTIPLREAWLAFGQLLETADQKFDVGQCAGQVELAKSTARWPLVSIGVVVASLLIGLGAIWMLDRAGRHGTIEGPPNEVAAPKDRRVPHVAPMDSESTVQPDLDALVDNQFQWDDALDHQIAEMQGRLLDLREGWSHSYARLHVLDQELRRLGQEFDEESL